MPAPNKQWRDFIPDGSANKAIALWFANEEDRVQDCATPSSLTDCPRVVWWKYRQKRPITNERGWGQRQRLLLGRNFENQIAKQYEAAGQLLHHWKDDVPGESDKFYMGEGLGVIAGTPDLLLQIGETVYISDAKTSRSDSFAYVPLDRDAIFQDPFWHKYKLQLTAYYMLCHRNAQWFHDRDLPLPTACHLFSFALDDGVVRRELVWSPTEADAREVMEYAMRWNAAYQSDTLPECSCNEVNKGAMFCPYASEFTISRNGSKLGSVCCQEGA